MKEETKISERMRSKIKMESETEIGGSMESRTETRKEQKERRRKEILSAALTLFVKNGFAATKITDIAKEVPMSTGLLFHYFSSKEALYEELVRMGLEGTRYPAKKNYLHAIDFFTGFATELFQVMKQDPMVAKLFVLMAGATRNEATPKPIRALAKKVETVEQFASIVEWGQREGSIREGNPLALSSAFWCAIQGIAENYAGNPTFGLPEPMWVVDIVRKHLNEE